MADSLFERMLRGDAVPRVPVWAMRQAGRWDPMFQKIREGWSFFDFANNPELAARASLCPRRFGVDAIILFYDITTLSIAMGQPFTLQPGAGPVPDWPIRTLADLDRLTTEPDDRALHSVLETLRLVQQELDGALPVLGFAGAPFTLATYMIGTGKNLAATRQFIREQPETWVGLLDRLAIATEHFLKRLLAAGIAAYQLFDSWAGALSPSEYRRWALGYHQRVFAAVGGPSILFVKDAPDVGLLAESGARVLSLGVQHVLSDVQRRFPDVVVQGNVDHELLIRGTPAQVRQATQRCLEECAGKRHILNLDHGMDRSAKPENFAAFVATATGTEVPVEEWMRAAGS